MNEEKPCGHVVTDECDCAGRKPLDVNKYATKKTIAQGMLDIALLTANASQLKYILQVGSKHEFYSLMLGLIITSIILQVSVGILFLVIGGLDIKRSKDQRAATILNDIILVLIFIISLINVVISSFGMEYTNNQLRLIKQNPIVAQAILGAVLGSVFNINKKKDQRNANLVNNVILTSNIVIVALNVIISAFDLRDQTNYLRLDQESVKEYPTEASSSFFL